MADERKRIVGRITPEMVVGFDKLKKRHSVNSDSDMVYKLVAEAIQRMEGWNTKELRLERMEEDIKSIAALIELAMFLIWGVYIQSGGGGKDMKFNAEDVAELRASIDELK